MHIFIYICCVLLQTTLGNKNDRIEELEEALKESVRITAEREMAMAEQHTEMEELKLLVKLTQLLTCLKLLVK